MLAIAMAICYSNCVWVVKNAFPPGGGGFGGFICDSELNTTLFLMYACR
jgi:hypothetical protein